MSKLRFRLAGSFFLVVVIFTLSGCEYSFLLSPKQGLPLDNALIGVWRRNGEGNVRLEISKKNPTEYRIVFYNPEGNVSYSGYPIKVGAQRLVQIIEDKQSAKPYDVASYFISGDQLTIKLVKVTAGNQADLRRSVLANKPEIYSDYGKYTKVTRNAASAAPARNLRWVTSLKKDSITDAEFSIAANLAQEKNSILYIKCSSSELNVFVEWGSSLEDLLDTSDYNVALKYIRWDSETAYKMLWNLSPNRRTTYAYTTQSAALLESLLLPMSFLDFPKAFRNRHAELYVDDRKFLRLLLNHQRLVIRATSANATDEDSTFDITNTANSIKRDLGPCLNRYSVALD
jgi:hypothetical protein